MPRRLQVRSALLTLFLLTMFVLPNLAPLASAQTGFAISTIAGRGTPTTGIGDGGPATSATLSYPNGLLWDAAGDLLIADLYNQRIRKLITATGVITTIAGTGTGYGTGGFSGDGSLATAAKLNTPGQMALDAAGNLYIADTGNNRVRKIDASTGIISTVAGSISINSSGDDGPATSAGLSYPSGVAVDDGGNIYIAESNCIRLVTASTGIIATAIGTCNTAGYSGDGSSYTNALLKKPSQLLWLAGILYITDTNNYRIRKVDGAGIISTIAGTGSGTGLLGDGGPATSATLNLPNGIALDATGNLYIAASNDNRIRMVDPAGTITTVAGTGTSGFSGDGGPATSAKLSHPSAVLPDAAGNVYIADYWNNAVRKLTPMVAPVATTSAATNLSASGATLNGSVNTNGVSTDVTFELTSISGDYTNAITTTATQSSGLGSSTTTVSATLSGLNANTTYYFRVVATSVGGTTTGSEQSFTTNLDGTPTISLGPVSLPSGKISTVYTQTISATGGTAPYSFTLSAGSLPSGLTLGTNGKLSGTPTVTGTTTFTVTATDARGFTGNARYELLIRSHPTVDYTEITVKSLKEIIISGTATPECTIEVELSFDAPAAGQTAAVLIYRVTADRNGIWSINTLTATPVSGSFPANGLPLGTALTVQTTPSDAEGEGGSVGTTPAVVAVRLFLPMIMR